MSKIVFHSTTENCLIFICRLEEWNFPDENETNRSSVDFRSSLANMLENYEKCSKISREKLLDEVKDFVETRLNSTSLENFFDELETEFGETFWTKNSIDFGTEMIFHIEKKSSTNFGFPSSREEIEETTEFVKIIFDEKFSGLIRSRLEMLLNFSVSTFENRFDRPETEEIRLSSSIRRASNLSKFIGIFLEEKRLEKIGRNDLKKILFDLRENLRQNFSSISLLRNSIDFQCKFLLENFVAFRSIVEPRIEVFLELIVEFLEKIRSEKMSNLCSRPSVVRQEVFRRISLWNSFVENFSFETRKKTFFQIRTEDFFLLDRVFRFLAAQNFRHFSTWKIFRSAKIFGSIVKSSDAPIDCLAQLERFYPFTLAKFFDEIFSEKIQRFSRVVFRLAENLFDRRSAIEIDVQSERLKNFRQLTKSNHFPFEFYPIEENYSRTFLQMFQRRNEEDFPTTHQLFEINGHHERGKRIFLQPTVGLLFSDDSTRFIALLIVAHELGHAFCPCPSSSAETEFIADFISLRIVLQIFRQDFNAALTRKQIQKFFFDFARSECLQLDPNRFANNTKSSQLNRLFEQNQHFQNAFQCSHRPNETYQQSQIFIEQICAECRRQILQENEF